jgi:hypothetical protein
MKMNLFPPDAKREFGDFDEVTGTDVGATKRGLDVNLIGTIGSVLNSVNWDGGSLALPDAVTEIYSFKTGGSSGTTVATVTLVYTSAAKTDLLTWDIVVV